jgi:excinuclease ABC subunit C
MLRRIFPYSDHKKSARPCLYSHIGLCNPCPSIIEKEKNKYLYKIYKRNIRRIKAVLSGRLLVVKEDLVKEMLAKSKLEEYEEALVLKGQIEKLNYITQAHIPTQSFLESPNLFEDIRASELKDLIKILAPFLKVRSLIRIECFDVAHLAGENATASMVTFIKAEAEKSLYRHFRIFGKKKRDDISALNEVIVRRKKYFDTWGRPDLVIVDGGKGQVSSFYQALKGTGIPVIGLAKREETLVIPVLTGKHLEFKEKKLPKGPARNLVQRIRDEAHRFARRYHHLLVKKTLLSFS